MGQMLLQADVQWARQLLKEAMECFLSLQAVYMEDQVRCTPCCVPVLSFVSVQVTLEHLIKQKAWPIKFSAWWKKATSAGRLTWKPEPGPQSLRPRLQNAKKHTRSTLLGTRRTRQVPRRCTLLEAKLSHFFSPARIRVEMWLVSMTRGWRQPRGTCQARSPGCCATELPGFL